MVWFDHDANAPKALTFGDGGMTAEPEVQLKPV